MAYGTAGRNGAQDDSERADGADPWAAAAEQEPDRHWPVSAICWVAVLSVLVLLLLLVNVLGLRFGRNGHYDPQAGGSVAEWLGTIGTLIALPAAVLFGVRQLQSTNEALQLGRHQMEADRAERAERRAAELAALRSALRLQVEVTNIVDSADLAAEAELAAVERWRHEYGQRGWIADAGATTWQQGSVRRSNVELLTAEASPLVPQPWFVAATCRNTGSTPLFVHGWKIEVDGTTTRTTTTFESPAELGPAAALRRRLGAEAGLSIAYADRADAEAAAASIVVVVEGRDAADRPVRIVHPPSE
jgi:hypothetical protein